MSGIRIFNSKFPSLCEIFYSCEYCKCIDSTSAFLNNFENVVNRRVEVREDIKILVCFSKKQNQATIVTV